MSAMVTKDILKERQCLRHPMTPIDGGSSLRGQTKTASSCDLAAANPSSRGLCHVRHI